ncbi:YbjN domain-containing protein [Paracoccus lutimaris]|uniref:Putative sensory transduction regulator n=1 Tax=Paracoccus lutimaris TaxID=1490030 RepID=A0A368ZAW1_9RHOB|nr:YbjN domain-containing protein [Paracoccus lutimaris]RCW88337.1 putative sensory transduction regulator [Paracoccus lutimaris]
MRPLFPLLVAMLCVAPPAFAQVLGDPDQIAGLMQEAGLQARHTTSAEGGPMLESSIDGVNFHVYFYECVPACAAIQFSAGFDLDEAMPMEMANLWNRDRRFGKVYLDRTGDPFIDMDIGLAGDGIGRENFRDALDTWRVVLSEFRDYIDW